MQRGFTLIEVVVAVAVLSILAGMAVPRINQAVAERDLDNTARILAADLRWLQQLSINTGATNPYVLTFSNGTPYGYYITESGNSVKTVRFPDNVQLAGTFSPITFSINGAPTASQSIGIKHTKINKTKYVIVAVATGRVRISDVSATE